MKSLRNDIHSIKVSLIIIATVVVMFVLRLFSFIFIPFFLALFFALLLLPVLDWFERRKIPKWAAILMIGVASFVFLSANYLVLKHTSAELIRSKDEIIRKAEMKLSPMVQKLKEEMGMQADDDGKVLDINKVMKFDTEKTIAGISKFVTGAFMTLFFLALFLTGAHLFEDFLNRITNHDEKSIQIFREIKGSLNGFIKVKFFTSLFTGIGFGLAAMFFDVKFALFWGLTAFLLNFVQLLGSVFITTVLAIFGFVEINSMGSFLVFTSIIVGIQVVIGGILEPIFMGKSFKINTISVLISLAIWGFIFGIPGLILAIPIAVFLKIAMEKIPATRNLAHMMDRVQE